jgi:hypothetical protein
MTFKRCLPIPIVFQSYSTPGSILCNNISPLTVHLGEERAAVFCGPANVRIFGRTSSGQRSMRNSIASGCGCPDDTVFTVSIDDKNVCCAAMGASDHFDMLAFWIGPFYFDSFISVREDEDDGDGRLPSYSKKFSRISSNVLRKCCTSITRTVL